MGGLHPSSSVNTPLQPMKELLLASSSADESDGLLRTKYLDGCRNEGKLGYLEAFFIAVRWFTADFISEVL